MLRRELVGELGMDELKGLATDKWYRALPALSVILIVGAAALTDDPELRKTLILCGFAGLLIGIGQWIDHPFRSSIHGHLKFSGYPYRPSLMGSLITLAGVVVALRGIWRLW